MASNVQNRAVKELADGTYTWLSSTIKAGLVGTAVAFTPNVDKDFLDEGGANDIIDCELNGVSGYTRGFGGAGRKALASKTITEVDASDRAEFSSAGLTWTALGAGDTIAYIFFCVEVTNDAASKLIAIGDVTDTPTNGGDVTINPGTGGWFYGTTV